MLKLIGIIFLIQLSSISLGQDDFVLLPKSRATKSKFQELTTSEAISFLNTKATMSDALKQKEFSVLVWNLFKGVKKEIFKGYPEMANTYDLLLLQEAYTTPEMIQMFEATTHHYTLAGSFLYRPQNVITGVATGARVKPLSEIPLKSKYKEPIVDSTQMCLVSEFKIEGSKENLLVVNVHAITFVPSDHLFAQLEQFKTVIEKHKGPVILGGDFNTWDEKKTKYLMRIVKILRLNSIEYAPDVRRKFKDYPLDYLFYRGLKLKYARALQLSKYSDHNPIEAGFSIP